MRQLLILVVLGYVFGNSAQMVGMESVVETSDSGSADDWTTNYQRAISDARRGDRVVLALFTGSDWCGWCIRLHDEVFSKPKFTKWAKTNAVLLELDFPRKKSLPESLTKQNEKLAEKFGVRGFPTVVALDSRGRELARTGYVKGGPTSWIADLEKKLAAAESDDLWLTDFEEARALAKKYRKPLLVDFTGSDWCHWCIRFKKEILATKEFKDWAKKNVILVELDFPRGKKLSPKLERQNRRLAEKYGVSGFPTVLILTGKGREIGRSGYLSGGSRKWIENAKKLIDDAR